ncbi:tryptophan--tRNA ligase, mitochondrial-like [Dreissena polymorpha]|nr:tryptophan--tRNA ligase, mitochondrial-like [Dreissena polymorpha]
MLSSTPPPHIQGSDSIHTSEDISLYARHHGKLTDEGKHKLLTWDWSPHAGLTSMCSHGQGAPSSPTVAGQVKEGVRLYTYPILQSADIMLYKSTVVPVGEDQLTHLELARDLARAFNRQYGTLFPAFNSYIGYVPKIRSLKDPSSKMSKSDNNAASRIDLTDSSSTVRDKIAKAVTDAVSKDITFDPELRPGISNLIDICSALTGKSSEDIVKLTQDKGMDKKTFKEFVTETVNESIQPISSEMQRILSDRGHLRSILKQGQERASVLAEETIKQVKTLVGLS